MAIRRSIEEVSDALDQESAWRKRELGTLGLMIQHAREHERSLLQRAAIALAYAHWEGFVKTSVEQVLGYLSRQGLKLKDVNHGLLVLSVEARVRHDSSSMKRETMLSLVDFLRSNLDQSCKIERKIDTKSNLSIEVFTGIFAGLGIDPALVFESEPGTTDIDIDERLLHRRNAIAHGTYMVPPQDECQVMIAAVQALITVVSDCLIDYLLEARFRKD